MSRGPDLTGRRFGHLVVKHLVGTDRHRKRLWRCQCDCEDFTTVRTDDLKRGKSKSCACYLRSESAPG